MNNKNVQLEKNNIDNVIESLGDSASDPSDKKVKTAVDEYISMTKEFENKNIELAFKETGIYKKISIVCVVVTVMAIVALLITMKLTKVVPFVLEVDKSTGAITALSPMSDAKETTYGEVLDKYWISQFVIARTGYEWETIQSDYNVVQIMGSVKVFGAYDLFIQSEESPVALFEDKRIVKVKINSVSFLPKTSDTELLAQVHFSRRVENGKGALAANYHETQHRATLTFNYTANIKTESERALNPLGFLVTSFREDRVLK